MEDLKRNNGSGNNPLNNPIVEVVKLIQVSIKDRGEKCWIICIEDFKRLISRDKLTLSKLCSMGFSRANWDNTLAYYNLGLNDVEELRKTNYTQTLKNKSHGNSLGGFTTKIPISKISNPIKIEILIKYINGFFPGFLDIYAKYHTEPIKVTDQIGYMIRECMELNKSLRYVHSRVRKWAVKKNLPYSKTIQGKLENDFAKILDELGLIYLNQEPLNRKYFIDFYIPDKSLYIEVDGGGHKGKNDKIKERIVLKKKGNFLRFKIKDTKALTTNYAKIKDSINKACGE